MTPARKKRITLIGLMVIGIAIATGFALKAFNENLMFFFSPTDVTEGKAPHNVTFRLGGMVVEGTLKRTDQNLTVRFDVTDTAEVVSIEYTGILPDLFREGQGIVANGRLREDGVFVAEEVLAKHDENYMPPEVADSMAKAQAKKKEAAGGP